MKTKVITLGFVAAEVFEKTVEELYTKWKSTEYEHYFLDQHFPLDKERNHEKLKDVCKRWGITYVDSGFDRGASGGFNYLASLLSWRESEVFIGIDPDETFLTPNWDRRLLGYFDQLWNEDIGTITLNTGSNLSVPGCTWTERGELSIPGGRCTVQAVSAWRWKFLKEIGGFGQPTTHYGHNESYIFDKCKGTNWKTAVARPLFTGPSVQQDPLYTAYKIAQASFQSHESFEAWLGLTGRANRI